MPKVFDGLQTIYSKYIVQDIVYRGEMECHVITEQHNIYGYVRVAYSSHHLQECCPSFLHTADTLTVVG